MDNNSRDLIINRAVPPFDNTELRRAIALSLDRHAFIQILAEGQGEIGGAMLPPPDGVWGMTPDACRASPVTAPMWRRTAPKRATSCKSSATGPDKRLRSSSRPANVEAYRDAAVIAISSCAKSISMPNSS